MEVCNSSTIIRGDKIVIFGYGKIIVLFFVFKRFRLDWINATIAIMSSQNTSNLIRS